MTAVDDIAEDIRARVFERFWTECRSRQQPGETLRSVNDKAITLTNEFFMARRGISATAEADDWQQRIAELESELSRVSDLNAKRMERIAELEAENKRLRDEVAKAPHQSHCECSYSRLITNPTCTCWKSSLDAISEVK